MSEDGEVLDEEVLEEDGGEELERDTVSTAEEIEAAKALHWVDKPDFRGEGGAQWKTAHDFLEHGKEVLPILRRNNEVYRQQLAQEARERQRLESELRAMGTSLKAIREAQEEDQAANAEARKAELKAELAEASEKQDGARVAEITEQLIQLGQEMAKGKPAEEKPRTEVNQPEIAPEVQEFVRENSWYVASPEEAGMSGKDVRRTRMMNLVAAEMRASGDRRVGREFLLAVKAEVDRTMPDPSAGRQRPNSVEGSRGGGVPSGNSGKTGRYDELPTEAKAQCQRDIKSKNLVGPGKRHKTAESYMKSYAALYFQE